MHRGRWPFNEMREIKISTPLLQTFENKQIQCSVEKILKSKLIHLLTLSFSDCQIYQEIKHLFNKELFDLLVNPAVGGRQSQ